MVEETAMASERLLIMKDVNETFWQRIKTVLARYEVDRDAGPENVWDVRDRGSVNDVIYLWGRDGWREGYWHAVLQRSGAEIWMERGSDPRADLLTRSRKRFAVVVEPLLYAWNHDVEIEATKHTAGSQ